MQTLNNKAFHVYYIVEFVEKISTYQSNKFRFDSPAERQAFILKQSVGVKELSEFPVDRNTFDVLENI